MSETAPLATDAAVLPCLDCGRYTCRCPDEAAVSVVAALRLDIGARGLVGNPRRTRR